MGLVFVWNHLSGGMASLRQDNHLQIFGATVTSMGEGEGVNSLWLGQYIIYFRNLPARAFLDTCDPKRYSGKLAQPDVPSLVLGITPPALGTNLLGFESGRLVVDI